MWSFLFLFLLLMQQLVLNNLVASSFEEPHRVKRITHGPPRARTTAAPLTSEEMREKESGTESPHLYDYPESIYKNQLVRKGEWNGNPIPKKKTRNVTRPAKEAVKPKKTKAQAKRKPLQPTPKTFLNVPFVKSFFGSTKSALPTTKESESAETSSPF